jgi:putative DNA methylase
VLGAHAAADGRMSRFPDAADALLSEVVWEDVEARVRAQQRNREVHTPTISLFRWWARRPHALIGAILDAASDTDVPPVVSDPFSGGGTVALEAVRRGCPIYAQDLHPWAIAGLRGALEEIDPDELELAAGRLLSGLADTRRRLYGGTDGDGADTEVITALWVRRVVCPCCALPVFLYPYSYISRASRLTDEPRGWWGCTSCGSVTQSSLDAKERRCSTCRRRLAPASRPLLPDRKMQCPHPTCGSRFDALEQPTTWTMALVQRTVASESGKTVRFDRPTTQEISQGASPAQEVPTPLAARIPQGLETSVLHRAGLDTWQSLYVPRQIESLVEANRVIDELRCSVQIKRRLRLAVCGAGEMAGRISRWDRHYPKAYEAVANHRFAVTGLSAEVNLLADRGRGVLKHRLAASVKAARWRQAELPAGVRIRRREAGAHRLGPEGAVLAQGSSDRQLAPRRSVDLVLTDPPYFDDVQYAELAALFLVWAQATTLVADSVEVELKSEAVANTRRGTDVERYRELLTAIFRETRRSLRQDGRMILTFHNTDLRAWWALGRALADAEFSIRALAVAWAENDVDHSKRGRRGFTRDLVIECRRTPSEDTVLIFDAHDDDPQARELISAGRSVATMTSDETLEAFRDRYRTLRGPTKHPRISPTEQERRDD